MTDILNLSTQLKDFFSADEKELTIISANNEITLEVARDKLLKVCLSLRDEKTFNFNMLIDVCGVDYLHYGLAEWETTTATSKGFERGVDRSLISKASLVSHRFAVVIHLLSIEQNQRLRLRVWLDEDDLILPSVVNIWPSANWFEREAFDLFGIIFSDHPDLRRILTDYGFRGYPFRKDFPISGHVEPRYDAALQRVVYEPVKITPRILEPKVIRQDNRYLGEKS